MNIYSIARSAVLSRGVHGADADDALQEAAIRVWELSEARPELRRGYLFRAAQNAVVDFLRRQKGATVTIMDVPSPPAEFRGSVAMALIEAFCGMRRRPRVVAQNRLFGSPLPVDVAALSSASKSQAARAAVQTICSYAAKHEVTHLVDSETVRVAMRSGRPRNSAGEES